MSIRAVFLDLDGTLHNFESAARKAMEQTYCKVTERYPKIRIQDLEREYASIWETARRRTFSDGKTSLETRTERFTALLARFGIQDKQLANEMVGWYGQAYHNNVVLFQYAKRELVRIKSMGISLYIVTDGSDMQSKVVESLGIAPLVSDIFTAQSAKMEKQNGDLFRYALAKSKLRASEVVVVGDSYERDVQGASAAGILAVWIDKNTRHSRPTGQQEPVAVIHEIRKLGDVIESIVFTERGNL